MATETGYPVKKVAIGAAAGASVTVFVLILNIYVMPALQWPLVPGELAAALTTLISFISSYYTPPAQSETAVLVGGEVKSALHREK